jgi:hypothetical protein
MSVREPETVAGGPAQASLPQRLPGRDIGPWLPVVALWGASGIALLSVSFALARANVDLDTARVLFLGAVAAIGGPALVRMLAPSTGRSERVLLVALTALLFYFVKVLHEPVRLLYSDEFFHLANAQRLEETGELYGANLLLPVSADYPGLPLFTTALSELSGLGLFPCALLVIGLAKVVLSVTLFLIFERLSGSARIAGVGALLYCAHPNYLFWSSQFAYESLSLPLFAVVLLCVVARAGATRVQSMSWSALGCLVAVAVAITHHLTAYAMVLLLWVHVALTLPARRTIARPPIAMAVVATVASFQWATIVAGGTEHYLSDIFSRGVRAVSQAVSDTDTTRAPFQGAGPGTAGVGGVGGPPIDDQLLAAGSVLLVAVGVFAGVLAARRRTWSDPLALVLAVAALGAVAAYPLRSFPGAWEIANRTSDFLFIGVALMAALAAVAFVDRGRARVRVPAIAAAGVIAIAGGGVIGWPEAVRLPRPFTAEASGGRIEAPGPQMAQWARAHLPRDSTFIANDTNGRLLSVAGFERVWAGPTLGVTELLSFDVFPQWQWDLLRERRIDFVVVDRRVASADSTLGYFYPRPNEADDPPISNWLNVRRKYERLAGSGRIFDGGDIVVYDIRRPRERQEPPADG